ncbi:unnamed protein product [Rangifer tarandus platyrhynchus]|uniref:Uncharacterized protein n=1 Tax=Rangifer tarandus platyrhynchus TaxID=3082113 RepID=A0ABN8YWG9_RANTA|nr:unnamed protein product [Rangifer tarandus platyrhynchus]
MRWSDDGPQAAGAPSRPAPGWRRLRDREPPAESRAPGGDTGTFRRFCSGMRPPPLPALPFPPNHCLTETRGQAQAYPASEIQDREHARPGTPAALPKAGQAALVLTTPNEAVFGWLSVLAFGYSWLIFPNL